MTENKERLVIKIQATKPIDVLKMQISSNCDVVFEDPTVKGRYLRVHDTKEGQPTGLSRFVDLQDPKVARRFVKSLQEQPGEFD